jgi:large subunit ribosomal protein L21
MSETVELITTHILSSFFRKVFLVSIQFLYLHSDFDKSSIMYAIVNIAGKQFKVTKDQFVYAPKMAGETGASVEFDQVLLAEANGTVSVGAPLLAGAKVSGKILDHVKGDKVIVFKKKRRKGYKKKNGHRQDFTKVMIESITLSRQSAKKSINE